MVQSTSSLDRARGAMLGSAVGDALGAPLEGLSLHQIRAHYGQVVEFVDGAPAWRRKPFRWRMPGLYSDDTQQALVVADVLLDRGRVDPAQMVELYLELAKPPGAFLGAYRGVSRTVREAVEALGHGRRAPGDSAGCGAAVRVAPLAIFYAGRPELLTDAVLDASLVTHRDCRALAGALAIAHAVRRLAAGAAREPSLLLRLAGDVAHAEARIASLPPGQVLHLRAHGHSLSRAIAHVESILDWPRARALAALADEANRHGPAHASRRPTVGFAPACIPTCLYLLLTTDSLEEALIEAVNLGGDSDAAGAMLGAMAGAHYGLGAIPERWLDGLHNREGIDLRAEALHRRTAEGLAIPDLVETERRLSELECQAREPQATQGPGGDRGFNGTC